MINYYQIIEGTEAYDMAYRIYHCMEDWHNEQFEKEFEESIGVGVQKNLICNTHGLNLVTIPEGTRDQFCKNKEQFKVGFAYKAKKNSELNKKFMLLIAKYNLKYFEMSDLVCILGFGYWSYVHPFNKATFFVMESRDLKEDALEKISKLSCLKEISAADFYRMKAEEAEAAMLKEG